MLSPWEIIRAFFFQSGEKFTGLMANFTAWVFSVFFLSLSLITIAIFQIGNEYARTIRTLSNFKSSVPFIEIRLVVSGTAFTSECIQRKQQSVLSRYFSDRRKPMSNAPWRMQLLQFQSGDAGRWRHTLNIMGINHM